MKGVKFNDIHSYEDLNLVLAPFQMPPAEPKTNFIDVPGADGSLDMTEALGEVKFNDRTGSMTFSVLPQDDFEVKKTQVSNLLNGIQCKITLDKDPEFYYFGRLSVKDYKANKMLRQITVDFRVHPYKYKNDVTIKTFDLTKNTQEVILSNNRKSVAPEIDLVSTKHIEKGTSIQIDSGDSTAKALDFRLFGKSTQDGTPTPDAPIDIVSVENPVVNIGGKNLFKVNVGEANGVKLTKVNDYYVLNGTATSSGLFVTTEPLSSGTYTLSANNPTHNNVENAIVQVYSPTTNCSLVAFDKYINSTATLDLVGAEDYQFRIRYENGVTYNNYIIKPQLELGTSATEYEEYKGKQTIGIPYSLNGIPVSSGGNYTDSNGQQWICDEIDLIRGVYVQRVKSMTLDGNTQIFWGSHSNGQNYIAIYPKDISSGCTMLSSHYKSTKWSNENNYIYCTGATIVVTDSRFINLETAQNILSSETPLIMYALATPIETPLEDATFKLNAPITTIMNNEGAEMQLEYSINALVGFDGNTFAVSEGTHKILDIYLKQGEHPLSLTGSGSITFKYQEGAL